MTNARNNFLIREQALERIKTIAVGDLEDRIDRARGCLIGGAIGDALGAPVEFLSRVEILHGYGSDGLCDFAPAYGKVGAVTDDTQMALFTAEGLLRATVRNRLRGIGPVYAPMVDHAYARWMVTQGESTGFPSSAPDQWNGWLITHEDLFARRAPGNTCLSALRSKSHAGTAAVNGSKGCGGVMRVAPVGLFCANASAWSSQGESDKYTFDLGCEVAGLTHGHVTGQLPAGYLVVLISVLAGGRSWHEATARAEFQLARHAGHEETLSAVGSALCAAVGAPWSADELERLGGGWIAEEALSMALYCAACALQSHDRAEAVRDALLLSVNHGGDSDSTGSITGNLLGAAVGFARLPQTWRDTVELASVVNEISEDLATFLHWDVDGYSTTAECRFWCLRYPGA